MANLTGTANNDIFQGTVDNDVIQGLAGNDSIIGNSGDDIINAGLGYDTVHGATYFSRDFSTGAGNDLLIVDYSSNTYIGSDSGISSSNNNRGLIIELEGYFSAYYNSNYEADVVNFYDINRFQITGTVANDDIKTGNGNDTIVGGNGNDTITGGAGINTIDAGVGTDTLVDGNFEAATTALSFSDTINYSSPIVLTNGTSVSNVEKFTNVTTGSGNDTISYSQRNNNDFTTGSGDDTINGGLGDDTVNGGNFDTVADNDLLIVDYSSNTYTGSDGNGINSYTYSNEQVESRGYFSAYYNSNYEADRVRFYNINRFQITGTAANDNIQTGDGNDTIVGGVGNDTLNGQGGNDSIIGGAGIDTLIGGAGNDAYIVDTATDTLTENANEGADRVSSSVTYTLGSNIENLTLTGTIAINGAGNILNNVLTGNSANNLLSGGAGIDTLIGGAGNDSLTGGADNDSLAGGAGSDRFIYNTKAAFTNSSVNIDLFADFASGTDKIVLDKTTFTSLISIAGSGFSVNSEFAVVDSDASVANTSALIVYSSGTGNLFYNQNGVTTGLGSGGQFATLSEVPALNADDFILQA